MPWWNENWILEHITNENHENIWSRLLVCSAGRENLWLLSRKQCKGMCGLNVHTRQVPTACRLLPFIVCFALLCRDAVLLLPYETFTKMWLMSLCVRNNGSGWEMGNKKFFTITEIFLLLWKNAGLLFANGSILSMPLGLQICSSKTSPLAGLHLACSGSWYCSWSFRQLTSVFHSCLDHIQRRRGRVQLEEGPSISRDCHTSDRCCCVCVEVAVRAERAITSSSQSLKGERFSSF